MKKYLARITKLTFGLFLYALGIYLTVQASIGLAPWEVFAQGLSLVTGMSFGAIIILT